MPGSAAPATAAAPARRGPGAARLDLLGTAEFRVGEVSVPTGGQHQTAILARLALAAPHRVSVDDLVDALWGDDRPTTARHSLSTQISRLRRAVATGGWTIDWGSGGYLLGAPGPTTDVAAFDHLVQDAEAALALGRTGAAISGLRAALGLWRGPAFGGLPDAPFVLTERHAVANRRRSAEDRLASLLLADDRADEAAVLLEELSRSEPLDERRWTMLVEALDRAGRPADALAAARAARLHFREALGLDPGPTLRASELRVIDRATPVADPSVPDLLGRRTELARAIRTLTAARDDGPRLLVVVGPPGTGRSRFLDEVLARAEGPDRSVVLRATPDTTLLPSLDAALEPLRDPGLLAAPAAADHRLVVSDRARRVQASIRRVEAATEAGPIALGVDDLEHVDRSTLALIREVVLGRAAPILIVVTMPPDPPNRIRDLVEDTTAIGRTETVHLGPLALPDARELARVCGLADREAQEVAATGDGLPARIVTAATLRRPAAVDPAAAGPDRTEEVLAAIAVAGPDASISLVAEVIDRYPREVLDAADRAIERAVLRADTGPETDRRLSFLHEETRREVLDRLDPDRRRTLHLLTARAIRRRRGDRAVTARHLLEVGDLVPTDYRLEALVAGADAALDAANIESARTLLAAATELADPPTRLELLTRRAAVDFALGDSDAGSSAIEEVLTGARAVGRWDLAAEALLAESNLGFPPNITTAIDRTGRIDEVLGGLGEDRGALRARLQTWVAHTLINVDHERALAAFEDADRLTPPTGRSRTDLEAARIRILASRRDDPGREMALADALDARCAATSDPLGRAMAAIMWTTAAVRAGAAIPPERLDLMAERARAATHPAAEYYAAAARALALTATAPVASAEGAVEEAERFGLARHLPGAILTGAMQRWPIRREQGRLGEYAPLVERLAAESDRPESVLFHAATMLELGDDATARSTVSWFVGLRLTESPTDWTRDGHLLLAADLVADLGLADLAAPLLDALGPRTGTVITYGSTSMALGPADRPLARLAATVGSRSRTAAHLNTAIDVARRAGSALWEGWCTLESVRLEVAPPAARGGLLDRADALAAEAGSIRLAVAVATTRRAG